MNSLSCAYEDLTLFAEQVLAVFALISNTVHSMMLIITQNLTCMMGRLQED